LREGRNIVAVTVQRGTARTYFAIRLRKHAEIAMKPQDLWSSSLLLECNCITEGHDTKRGAGESRER